MSDTPIQEQITEEQAKLDDIHQQQRADLQALNQINLDTETAKEKLDDLNTEFITVTGQVEAMQGDLDGLSTTRAGKLAEIDSLTDQIRIATAELETAKNGTDKAKADDVQATIDTKNAQAAIIADAQAALDSLKTQKANLESEIAPIAAQTARLRNQITAAQAQLVIINDAITTAQGTLSTIQMNQSVIADNIKTLQAQADSLTAEIATKTATSAALDVEIATKQSDSGNASVALKKVQATLAINNVQNADFLKVKAGVMAKGVELDQREAFLKEKYGELGETWQ